MVQRVITIRGGDSNQQQQQQQYKDIFMKNDDPDQFIGGGAINEKKRTFLEQHGPPTPIQPSEEVVGPVFQGTRNQAHFLHAMEGLDRYPNYLTRWNMDDSEELERALEQRLELVRQQRHISQQQRQQLETILDKVCDEEPEWRKLWEPPQTWDELQQSGILDPRASKAIFQSKFFRSRMNHTVPSLQDILAGNKGRVELDAGYLEEIMEEETFDVYSFPLLSESFCLELQAYMQRIMMEVDKEDHRHHDDVDDDDDHKNTNGTNSVRRQVRNLDHLRLGWLNDLLLHLVVRPISRHLYQQTEMGKGDLDWRHGFLAAYAAHPDKHKPRQRLVPHTDDAEVTLNICIGDIFEGGTLQFWGLRGTDMAGKLVGEYIPVRGRALLHAGRQLHEVTKVTSGDRLALILWTRSWSGVRSTTCPCCWLNRRVEGGPSSCICTARWN